MPSDDSYAQYKPIRNYMRQCQLVHILSLAYHFTQHNQFGTGLAPRFNRMIGHKGFPIERCDYLFETLTYQALQNCPVIGEKAPNDLAGVTRILERLHQYEDFLWGKHSQEGDILYEIVRKAHRQFPWQTKSAQDDWIRYFKIYNHVDMKPLVEEQFGMSVPELYQIGMSVFGHFLESPFSTLKWDNFVNRASTGATEAFFKRFACSLDYARALTQQTATYDINWAYNLDPLVSFPLLTLDYAKQMMCPIPTLLSWRLTGGLYFEIVSNSDEFRRGYGSSFEAYVGEVLEAAKGANSYQVLPAKFYGGRTRRNHSVDWIAEDSTGTLFVEAKAPRLKLARKMDLRSQQNIDEGLAQLGAFVCQVYKTLSHALDGRYPHWKAQATPVYPLIVTLDDWRAFGPLASRIDESARSLLEAAGVDATLLDRHPYTVCAIADFEDAIQIMANVGIRRFMDAKLEPKNRQSLFAGFILSEFQNERRKFVKDLFPNGWSEIDPRL